MQTTIATPDEKQATVADGFAEISEAQDYLRLSRATIYALMDNGALSFARFGRARRIPWRALREYAASKLVG